MAKNRKVLPTESQIRRLLAAGCPVPYGPETPAQPDLTFEVVRPPENTIFEVRFRGGTEFIFYGRIVNNSYRVLQMVELWCRLPWDDPNFTWRGPHPSATEVYGQPGGR